MRAQLVKIGNSRGVRLSKAIIEQAGLGRELEVAVEGDAVVIRSAAQAREGWDEDARECRTAEEDKLDEWDATIADGEWR